MLHFGQSPRRKHVSTVRSLRPSPVLAVQENASAIEAAAYMAAKRQDAVLVTSSDGHLIGILTDKDLVFRIISEGLDPSQTLVSDVMTRNPVSVTADTSATDALLHMMNGNFRHLPVVESQGLEGGVVGILDITKCLYGALEKLDRSLDASVQLSQALESVDRGFLTPAAIQYAQKLKSQLEGPSISSLLDPLVPLPILNSQATVYEASRMMKQTRQSAVLVIEEDLAKNEASLSGIFTTKDVTLRIMAAHLDPFTTPLLRVMTPHPDCVPPSMSVVDAVRKMNAGRYLHLPVINDEGEILGLVDVLRLTYILLEQMRTNEEGPEWSRFWEGASSECDYSPATGSRGRQMSITDMDSVSPDDSASRMSSPAKAFEFAFKLKDENTGIMHRFNCNASDVHVLFAIIRRKIPSLSTQEHINVSYLDEDGDFIHLVTSRDLEDAIIMAKTNGWAKIQLSLDDQRLHKHRIQQRKSIMAQSKPNPAPQKQPESTLVPMIIGGSVALLTMFILAKVFKKIL